MAQLYFSLVTTIGRIKLAASASGGPAVTITHFAIGDGNGNETNPTAASTALVREVWRTAVESVHPDPLNPAAILTTAIIPTNHGGWWMREFGIIDADGDMIAVAKPVSQYKPTAAEGQLEDIRYEFQIIIGETANVTLLVDPSILLASRVWVEGRKTPINRLLQTPCLPVKAMSVTNPPADAADGDIYVIPAAASGAWNGHAGKIAEWTGTAWVIFGTPDGHGVSLPDGRIFERIAGTYVEKIALDVQSGKWNFAVAGGTANALTGAISPAPVALAVGLVILLKIVVSNTGSTTLDLNGLGAKQIVNNSSGAVLVGGELVPGKIVELIYDDNFWRFLGISHERFANSGSFGLSGSLGGVGTTNWTVPPGVTRVKVRCWGGGGGGGGSEGNPSAAAGGGGGGYCEGMYSVIPGQVIPVTAGAAGLGGAAGTANPGTDGGSSSFGSYCTANGGGRGGAAPTSTYSLIAGAGGVTNGQGNVLNQFGVAGSIGVNLGSVGLGGGGGSAFGSAGSHPTIGNAVVAINPGGGGGGGANGGAGSSGGIGIVLLEW